MVRAESGLPTLAHLNLLAAVFESAEHEVDAEDLSKFIQELAYLADALDPDEVLRDINEDRAVSGFPEVRAVDQIESELAERKRHFRNVMKDALDKLPARTLVQVMTDTVDGVTSGGEVHAPGLIDDLVDSYEVETQDFLQKEAENVLNLIKAARDAASRGEAAVKPFVDKLEIVTRNWDAIAQPIQLSAKARGVNHEASRDLAYEVRDLAIELFNQHDMLTLSQRLTGLLQDLFAEVPDVSERVEQDADTLEDIFRGRGKADQLRDEWEREITYRAEIGLVFKDVLSISPSGVAWKGQSFPLESVTRVRWGGIRHSTSGSTYTIAFGDNSSGVIVELMKEGVFSAFIERLWKAVGVKILGEMLVSLKSGGALRFGNAILYDEGMALERRKFLRAREKVRCSWDRIHIWSADGSFCVGAKDDKDLSCAMSYIDIDNTHILEQAIRMAFKKPGMRRLSELLN
ncbi:MAG: hypothetical protein H6945_06440 [Zoogloeaceae bacterium]|nr:hypothetical protein [Zoogloeaceae bacterium]